VREPARARPLCPGGETGFVRRAPITRPAVGHDTGGGAHDGIGTGQDVCMRRPGTSTHRGRCVQGVDPVCDGCPPLVASDAEAHHEIVHGRRCGQTNRATHATCDACPSMHRCPIFSCLSASRPVAPGQLFCYTAQVPYFLMPIGKPSCGTWTAVLLHCPSWCLLLVQDDQRAVVLQARLAGACKSLGGP
jgi:hypothetical protein